MRDKEDILRELDYYKQGTTYEKKVQETLIEVLIDIRDTLRQLLEES